MEKDKKKILAGAAILGGAVIAYLLWQKKASAVVPTYTCPYCGESFATFNELLTHLQTDHPTEPVPGFGRVFGYIKTAGTGVAVVNARVYLDGKFEDVGDTNGMYFTSYVSFGNHMLTIEADNYTVQNVPVDIEAENMRLDISLVPLAPLPADWSEGVAVQSVSVTPSSVYLGEAIQISIYIQYGIENPDAFPTPADIHGTVMVDTTQITSDFHITFRNPTLKFNYTPTELGVHVVQSQGKSTSFTVVQDVVATYYSPFGGTRMPLCTDILVPNVAPFSWLGFTHPGGDLKFSDLPPSLFGYDVSLFSLSQYGYGEYDEVKAKLSEGQPIEWTPSDAVVTSWDTYFSSRTPSLLIMATEYTCPEYWDSKEELAEMIARTLGGTGIGIPWKPQYGTTCPTCGGTGQVLCVRGMRTCRPGTMTKCPTCNGLGKVVRIDLVRGLRDWVKPIRYVSLCGGGYCIPRIHCPYCDANIDGPSHVQGRAFDMLSFVRNFLTHIETKHPNHPLTEPAWF